MMRSFFRVVYSVFFFWRFHSHQKKVVGNFEQLRSSVNSGETDAFMWETFTTKPFHDSGEVKRVGDITTPWPCFLLAGLLLQKFLGVLMVDVRVCVCVCVCVDVCVCV